jgi:hypothetical protein
VEPLQLKPDRFTQVELVWFVLLPPVKLKSEETNIAFSDDYLRKAVLFYALFANI